MEQPVATPADPKPTLKERLTALYEEYGKIAITTYLAIWILVLATFTLTIHFGIKPNTENGVGLWAVLGGAWVAAKVTQPVRILATLVLTPLLGKLVQRLRKPPAVRG